MLLLVIQRSGVNCLKLSKIGKKMSTNAAIGKPMWETFISDDEIQQEYFLSHVSALQEQFKRAEPTLVTKLVVDDLNAADHSFLTMCALTTVNGCKVNPRTISTAKLILRGLESCMSSSTPDRSETLGQSTLRIEFALNRLMELPVKPIGATEEFKKHVHDVVRLTSRCFDIFPSLREIPIQRSSAYNFLIALLELEAWGAAVRCSSLVQKSSGQI